MKAIKMMREAMGLTQAELARRVGVTPIAIYRYEKGDRMPSLDTALRIATTLNCKLDDLLTE